MISNLLVSKEKKATAVVLILKIVFVLFFSVEIYGEFINSNTIQYATKPFLMPILVCVYLLTSKKHSSLYIAALSFNWLANLFFISIDVNLMVFASVAFLLYRILILIKIFKDDSTLGFVPIALGAIPFLFLFLCLINMVYESINGGQYYLILFQIVLMTLLGGFSLANFIIRNTISSKVLMISSMFFGINLFILGVKYYYIDFSFLKPISMIFFALGHITFYYFMILKEEC